MLNQDQARIVDPVLTNHAHGYRHPRHAGHFLFPRVEVGTSSGKVVEFGKESFVRYNARRAPGADTKRIQFGYFGKPYNLEQDSLEGLVPREIAREAEVPGVDMGMRTTNVVMGSLTLTLEYEQAVLATDAGNYDADHKLALTSGDHWNEDTGTPIDDVEAARQAIRASCGMYPNVAVFGPSAYASIKNSKQVTDRFRNADIVTAELLKNLLELDHVVEGQAVTAEDLEADFADVWGDAVVLAYAPQTPSGFEEPSFGYTYALNGHPYVERPYWEGNKKSWVYGVTYERMPVLTGMTAGFLISNVTATE